MGTPVGYPVAAMGVHVTICPNQQTGRTVCFDIRAVVAMFDELIETHGDWLPKYH